MLIDKPKQTTFENLAQDLVYVVGLQPDWVGAHNSYQAKHVLLHLFERLPGTTFLYLNWVAERPETCSAHEADF